MKKNREWPEYYFDKINEADWKHLYKWCLIYSIAALIGLCIMTVKDKESKNAEIEKLKHELKLKSDTISMKNDIIFKKQQTK